MILLNTIKLIVLVNQVDYKRIYFELIKKRKIEVLENCYFERHHILPRSLGGSDNKENIVRLTAKEHFIAHKLLVEIYKDDIKSYKKMVKAVVMMSLAKSEFQEREYNSNEYVKHRELFSSIMSEEQKGKKNSQYGTRWVYNENLKISKKVPKHELLDSSWKEGRKINFKYLDDNINKENIKNEKIELFEFYYFLYDMYGFENFVIITNYKHSKTNLVNSFKRYVKNYIPQNGKRRGI